LPKIELGDNFTHEEPIGRRRGVPTGTLRATKPAGEIAVQNRGRGEKMCSGVRAEQRERATLKQTWQHELDWNGGHRTKDPQRKPNGRPGWTLARTPVRRPKLSRGRREKSEEKERSQRARTETRPASLDIVPRNSALGGPGTEIHGGKEEPKQRASCGERKLVSRSDAWKNRRT
jgi:hypothetical protein